MLEIVVGQVGEVLIDNMEAAMAQFPADAKRALKSAMASEGIALRTELQRAITKGGPDGRSWEKLNPHTGILRRAKKHRIKNYKMVWRGKKKGSKWRGREYWESKKSTASSPLNKFIGGIRSVRDDDSVSTGFVGDGMWIKSVVPEHAKGFSIRVTDRMRRKFFAIGFPLKKTTTTLHVPARPLIRPVFEEQEPRIVKRLSSKFFSNIARYQDERAGVKWLKNQWGDYVAPE